MNRRRAAVAVGSLCAVGAVLVGVNLAQSRDPGLAPTGERGERAGLSPDQAAARVLGSIDDPAVEDVRVVGMPGDPTPSRTWVRTYLEDSAGDTVHGEWLAALVTGAVAELMRTDQSSLDQVIQGGDFVHTGRHGNQVTNKLGWGQATQEYFRSPSDADLRSRVDQVAQRYGLTVDWVRVLHPLDSALDVRLVVPPGHGSWTMDDLDRGLMGSPVDIEGLYVELDSPAGRVLLQAGSRERLAGGGWSGEGDRFGIVHG